MVDLNNPIFVKILESFNKDLSGNYILQNSDIKKIIYGTVCICTSEIENYRVPVGNSSAGELACEWTLESLKEIRDSIIEKIKDHKFTQDN